MQFITTTAAVTLLVATFAAAAPTNTTLLSTRSSFTGDVSFYERWDCTNACVEQGYCPFGKQSEGMKGEGASPFIGWSSGCWDVPGKAHSLGLSISNGHKFSSVGVTCKEFADGGFTAPTKLLEVGKEQACNVLDDPSVKAVFYHWDNN